MTSDNGQQDTSGAPTLGSENGSPSDVYGIHAQLSNQAPGTGETNEPVEKVGDQVDAPDAGENHDAAFWGDIIEEICGTVSDIRVENIRVKIEPVVGSDMAERLAGRLAMRDATKNRLKKSGERLAVKYGVSSAFADEALFLGAIVLDVRGYKTAVRDLERIIKQAVAEHATTAKP